LAHEAWAEGNWERWARDVHITDWSLPDDQPVLRAFLVWQGRFSTAGFFATMEIDRVESRAFGATDDLGNFLARKLSAVELSFGPKGYCTVGLKPGGDEATRCLMRVKFRRAAEELRRLLEEEKAKQLRVSEGAWYERAWGWATRHLLHRRRVLA